MYIPAFSSLAAAAAAFFSAAAANGVSKVNVSTRKSRKFKRILHVVWAHRQSGPENLLQPWRLRNEQIINSRGIG